MNRCSILLITFGIIGISIAMAGAQPPVNPSAQQFNDYWYPNGAEISRFTLSQSRYGETHSGDAVLIFVTETMNPTLQVKADRPRSSDIPVLKLNAVRKFYTGIYPYSIMASIFAPVDARQYPLPLKISFSSQEWCGQVYLQLNLKNDGYDVIQRSYFEGEADRDFRLEKSFSEDAILTRIRISPSTLPTGDFSIIPGTLYSRLLHRPLKLQRVTADLTDTSERSLEGNPLMAYTVRFHQVGRTLRITFDQTFPYRIQGWEDTTHNAAGKNGQGLRTQARRTHTMMIDYWNRHSNKDRKLLKKLGLSGTP